MYYGDETMCEKPLWYREDLFGFRVNLVYWTHLKMCEKKPQVRLSVDMWVIQLHRFLHTFYLNLTGVKVMLLQAVYLHTHISIRIIVIVLNIIIPTVHLCLSLSWFSSSSLSTTDYFCLRELFMSLNLQRMYVPSLLILQVNMLWPLHVPLVILAW